MMEHPPLDTSPMPVRLRIADYLLLDQGGAFERYAKTELIEGEILSMNAQHRPHARIKSRLHRLLADALDRQGGGLEAIVEGSIEMPPRNLPEPDIVVTCAAEGDGFIPLGSVALVVEVSDSTLAFDLGAKRRLYAKAGVSEYWVVDIDARSIRQMWEPTEGSYAAEREIAFGQTMIAAKIQGLTVETAAL